MEENEVLYTFIAVVSTISLLGSIFIIIVYNKFKSLQIYAFKLVYILTIFDGIRSLFSLIPSHLNLYNDSSIVCKIQGFMLEFSSLAGILWTGVIAFTIYLQLIKQKAEVHKYFNRFLFFVILFSLLVSSFPLITNHYMYAGGCCWITSKGEYSVIYIYGLFYAEVWIVIIFSVYSYVTIIKRVYKELSIRNDFLIEGTTLVKRLRRYPLILIFVLHLWLLSGFCNQL
jgi:Slime mold cyclic AMP receptor.